MNLKSGLCTFIRENIDEIIITGGISDNKISDIEDSINVTLPETFKNYLKEYGTILGFGVEFLGCGKDGIPSVVRETKRYRKFGLKKDLIVIRNADEWIYCLNTQNGNVVSWDINDKNETLVSNTFDEYLFTVLKEAKEEW